MSFPYEAVVTSDGTIVSFKSIESFKFTEPESEDAVIDKLKDDVFFEFRTVSGKEYTSSALTICRIQLHYSKELTDTLDMDDKQRKVREVYERWLWLLKPWERK